MPMGCAGHVRTNEPIDTRNWTTRSAIFAAQIATLATSARGLDTCPMEGPNACNVARLLALRRGDVIPNNRGDWVSRVNQDLPRSCRSCVGQVAQTSVISFERDTMMDTRGTDMKEVFTKRFWEGVKKTFDEALEGPPPADTAPQTPAEGDLRASSTAEKTPSSSVSSERS